MRRVLIDTNVYVSFLNLGLHESAVLGAGAVRHMSTVVLMELEAGASTPSARRAVDQLARVFEKCGRLLPPPRSAWKSAGAVLRGLRAKGRETRRASLVHDVSIALTAREVGATLITGDSSDFAVIRKLVDFSFTPL